MICNKCFKLDSYCQCDNKAPLMTLSAVTDLVNENAQLKLQNEWYEKRIAQLKDEARALYAEIERLYSSLRINAMSNKDPNCS